VHRQATKREQVAKAERISRRGLSEAERSAYQYSMPTDDLSATRLPLLTLVCLQLFHSPLLAL